MYITDIVFIHTIATRTWSNVNVIRETKNKEIAIRGGEPPRRYGHACVLYNGRIYMFGGRNDDDGSFRVRKCVQLVHYILVCMSPKNIQCDCPVIMSIVL